MKYEEWVQSIEKLKQNNLDKTILESLKNAPYNENIIDMVSPKLIALAKDRFNIAVNKIIGDLNNIFDDVNYLDLMLVNFKKEILIVMEILELKEINLNDKNETVKWLHENTNKVYDILINEANKIDPSGVMNMTINYNKLKWSE